MKIITRKQLMAMPDQTLYCEYEPTIFETLNIKVGEPYPEAIDFWYDSLTFPKCKNDGEMYDILNSAKEKGTSFTMDLEFTGRDGMFDDDQLYMIWEKEDVKQLIQRLEKCL